MRRDDSSNTAEANEAAWEATRGAVIGAAKWGAGTAVLAGAGQLFSPLYRGFTIQFKMYVGVGVATGSMGWGQTR